MEPFVSLTARACVLAWANIDTDQIFPARFMKQPRAIGYDKYLFHGHRFDAGGRPVPGFPLDDPSNRGTRILVAGRNFGCGSSREAAVYALVDYGMRCVVAPSFGDIFASNAVNNGLLPARVAEADVEQLMALLDGLGGEVTVDLRECTILAAGERFSFAIDPVWRQKLLNGWDDVDLTRGYADAIAQWLQQDQRVRPWAGPPAI